MGEVLVGHAVVTTRWLQAVDLPHQRGVMVLRLPKTPELELDTLLTIEATPARIW